MTDQRFPKVVRSAEELAELIGTPSDLVLKKALPALDGHMTSFIADSPFLLIGTVGKDGSCDVSPRGDAPGRLAAVLDPRMLVIPERKGNRRADSLRNIIETGRVGLIFMLPGMGETLRVNGLACVTRDEALLAPLTVEGKTPVVGIGVEIQECFLQCAKALIRSKLWEPRQDQDKPPRPNLAEMLMDQVKIEGHTVESLNLQIEESYKNNLY